MQTPLTDIAELELIRNYPGLDEKRVMTAFDFARQLERELNARTTERDALHNSMMKLVIESAQWRQCAEELADSVRHIGWTSCEEGKVIRASEIALANFNNLKNSK